MRLTVLVSLTCAGLLTTVSAQAQGTSTSSVAPAAGPRELTLPTSPPSPPSAPETSSQMPVMPRRSVEAPASPPAAPSPAAPSAAPAATPAAVPPTDHAQVVGRIGLGWEGVSEVPLYQAQGELQKVAAPALGLRWWFDERLGLDVGFGIGYLRSFDTTSATTAFLLRAGVPYALYVGQHFTFITAAHLVFGHARSKRTGGSGGFPSPQVETPLRGYRLDLTLSGGAEVQFGFIGIPELALQGSVGFFVQHQWTEEGTLSSSETRITTSLVNNPWDFFQGQIAARYYF